MEDEVLNLVRRRRMERDIAEEGGKSGELSLNKEREVDVPRRRWDVGDMAVMGEEVKCRGERWGRVAKGVRGV